MKAYLLYVNREVKGVFSTYKKGVTASQWYGGLTEDTCSVLEYTINELIIYIVIIH